MMSKEKRRVPKLRFPGFTEDWEQRKLGDFTNQINTFVNPEDAKLPLWSLTAEAGLIEKSDRYERDFLVKKKDQFKRIETNTLVYNPMNITIGSIDIYTGLYPIAVSGYYVSIVYDKNIDTDFLKEVLLLPSSLKMYKNYATGSLIERQRVQYPTFSKLQLLLPNLDEQKAIGQLFKSLNLNITLHQRKLDNLKLKKKALLQKLFPKNGERYPELRFPGFTDAWEQRKFSDLYEKISEKNDLSYSLNKIISVANMYYKSDAKVSNEEYLKTYNIFRYGEIAFEGNKSKDFAYGRFVENTIGDGIISHVFEVFRPIVKYDIYFWKYYINYEPIMGKVLSRCTKKTTMMTNLVAKDFLKETVLVPTLAEQKQIGTLLNTLDKFITLHQRKLDHLQLKKKALLQQMFV